MSMEIRFVPFFDNKNKAPVPGIISLPTAKAVGD